MTVSKKRILGVKIYFFKGSQLYRKIFQMNLCFAFFHIFKYKFPFPLWLESSIPHYFVDIQITLDKIWKIVEKTFTRNILFDRQCHFIEILQKICFDTNVNRVVYVSNIRHKYKMKPVHLYIYFIYEYLIPN